MSISGATEAERPKRTGYSKCWVNGKEKESDCPLLGYQVKKGTVYFSGTGGTGETTKVPAPSGPKTTEVVTWSSFLGCFRKREVC